MPGFVTGTPNLLLRAEAAFLLAGAVAVYAALGSSWTLFALLALAPDLSMIAYLAGRRAGTIVYNAAHWECVPLGLLGYGFFGGSTIALDVGLIWLAHVAFDRMIGAGLKYPEGFRFSHLGVYGATDPAQGTARLGETGPVR